MIPQLLIEILTFFRRIIEGVSLLHTVEKTSKTLLSILIQAMVPVLVTILFFRCETASTDGNCKVGGALEDLQLPYHGPKFLRDLHARSSRPNDSHTLVLQIDT